MFFMRNLRKYLQSDGSAGFLRAARSGHLERVLEFLKSNTDINICNTNGLNALHLASKEGHVNVVRELVNRGANTDAATKKGNTALHIASLAGQEEVVKLLVQNNATVNVQSQNGFTPLYMAAQENHDSVVRYLLANGANQSLATEDGFTPLAVALQQGHDKVVAVLLENDTKGKVRLPALHIAAKKDDTKAAALLLQNEHNPDVTSKSGFTPLHIAAHYGNENIAALLLQRGADVNYAAKHNITPLHVAAKWGKSNMVTTLLEMKANIEAKTRDGLTPLHCAARSGHDSVVDMLLVKGAPLTSKTKNGLAPLHMASQGDHVDSARILLYNKAPVDDVTVDYLTALHVAAHCGHVRVAKMLLDRQADPNSRALNGFTPLHIACKKNRIKVVELLLKHGASIEATTESGLTPLHVASFMGCMNIVIYLIQHGSNPDTPTVRGETPLHLAARANQTDIIRILLRNGAMVDARAREQQTPLHIAARLGNVDIVVLLLQHGAAVDATTKDLYTALHIAAKEGQEEVAQVLVEHQASLSATTKKGFTPLHLAAKYGNMKVAKLLLQRDAPVDAEGRNGVTPLHVAAHYDNQNVALLLLDKGASPHAAAKNGYTPLHIAAKKNQMDIATTLLEYGASTNAESRAGFTPLHLSAQEGHTDMCSLLLEHSAQANTQAKNGLTPLHLCAQEDRVSAAAVLLKAGAEKDTTTKAGYTPLHVACHFGQMNMVRFLLSHECDVNANTKLSYTPLHQAAQQGHTLIVSLLLENNASPNAVTNQGQTPLSIAQKLGYISVVETLKVVTETTITTTTTTITEEKYRVLAPETMHETFLSDSEDEGGDDFLDSGAHPTHAQHVYLPYYEGQMLLNSDDNLLGDASYKYLTADEMKSLGDDSLPIDVTKDERIESRLEQSVISDLGASPTKDELRDGYPTFTGNYQPDNVDISHTPVYSGFLVSFMVDARGGAMRGCRHSGVRVIIPPRKAASPMRITCRYLKKEKVVHPPPLMEGEALASRILEMGPSQAKFLGPVIIEVPHFASLRGKEREITILRSDNGETWREHTLEASEEAVQDVLNDSFDGEELNALEDLNTNRITRILTTDFPQYFAIVTRVRQEIHAIGPEGGMVSSTVVPQVQAVFPQGALTKKIKVGLQAQPIQAELVSKLLGNRVAVSPIVTVEPRRRKFHKPITLTIPVPQASSKGMINEYSGDAPTLRLLCSITGGPSRAQWEDVTGSTPLTFVNECVSFTTTVSARFWLIDCRNIGEANKMATELYREAIHVPFMAKFVVFSKRHDPMEAALRVFCMTDDKEDKTLEVQEHFQEVAKSRDVEVLEAKPQYVEFAGNLVPVTKSGEQLKLSFFAFRENRLPFIVRIRDLNSEPAGRIAFMREPKVGRGEPPQTPICNLNLALPAKISAEVISDDSHIYDLEKKYGRLADESDVELIHKGDLQLSDLCNLLGPDWVYLARQLEIPESDINTIEYEYHDDTAKQAQVMVRLWMTRAGNKATGNTLEKALSSIGREDIMKKCLVNVELVTDDMEKAVAETCLDQSGFDALRKEGSMRRDGSLDVSYDEQDIIKESESAEEVSSSISSSADKSSQRIIHHEEKKDKEKTPSEERAIEKDSVVVERQIVDTCVVAEEVPEHEKGAWEEPEKDVEERIVPEKRASAVVSDEDKSQRPKHELLEELGKELGRLDSSFVPKSTREHPEVVGQLAVEEEMIVKERKGAKSPTTEQIEVFPEQLDQSSSGADTSHEEAACLGESETWQSDDLEKAVNRLDTELAAQDVVAAPVPATQQTNARLNSGVAGEETNVDEHLLPSPLKESPASTSLTHFSPEEMYSREVQEEISPAFEYPIGLTPDNTVNVGVSPTEEHDGKRRKSKETIAKEQLVWAEKSEVTVTSEEKEEGVEENIRPYIERKQFWEKMTSFSEKESEKRAKMMKRSMTDTSSVDVPGRMDTESLRTETESDTDTTVTDSTIVEQKRRSTSVDFGKRSAESSDSEPLDPKGKSRSPQTESSDSDPSDGQGKGKKSGGFVYDNSAFIGAEHIDEGDEIPRSTSPFEVTRSDSDDTMKDETVSKSPDIALKSVKEKTSIFEAEIQKQQDQTSMPNVVVTQTIKSEIFSSELDEKPEPVTQEEKRVPTDGSLEDKSEPLVSAQIRSDILIDQLNQPIEDQSPERKSLALSDSVMKRVGVRTWSQDTMEDVDAELESEVIIRTEKQDFEVLEKDFEERPSTLEELSEDEVDRIELESQDVKPSSPIHMPEQQFQDTIWEVTVESQQTPKEETTHDIPPESQVLVEKPEEEEEEQARKLSPTEARKIAEEIVKEIKIEAEKIAPLKVQAKASSEKETEKSRKMELIESVSHQKVESLRKKMEEHDAPSIDITDEDLKSGDLSPVERHTRILETEQQQVSLTDISHSTKGSTLPSADDDKAKNQGSEKKSVKIETTDFQQESSVVKEEKHSSTKTSEETVTLGNAKKEKKKVMIQEDSSLLQKEKEKEEVKAKVVFTDDAISEDISSHSEKSVDFKKDDKKESQVVVLEGDRKTTTTESSHCESEGKQKEEQNLQTSVRFTDDLNYYAQGSETKRYSKEERSSDEYKLKSETDISPDSSASLPLHEDYSSGGEKLDSQSESEKGETFFKSELKSSKTKEEATKRVHHKRQVHLKQEVESSSSGSKEEFVVMRPKKSELRVDDHRKSAMDAEAYSSSGESYYHSCEQTSSRPMSSDVEGLLSGGVTSEYDTARSYEYETAATSQDLSTSQDYQTAISSISSRDSMKSVDSESSGHLGSLEVSEASETLVPTAFEVENEQRGEDVGTPVPDEEVGDAETVPLITTCRSSIPKEEASSSDEAQQPVTPPANLSSSSTPVMPSTPKPKGKKGAVPYVVLSSESQEVEDDSDPERESSPFEFISDADVGAFPTETPDAQSPAATESHMKRSQEMTFYPEPKLMAEDYEVVETPVKETSESVISLPTILGTKEPEEVSKTESSATSEQLSALSMSATSEQLSDKDELKASTEELPREEQVAASVPTGVTSTGTSTPTEGVAGNTKSMTMITSSVPSSTGGQTVSTQITSAIYSPTPSSDESSAPREGPPAPPEQTVNTSVSNGPIEVDYIPEYDDNGSQSTSLGGAAKEARDDERKDVDESEKESMEIDHRLREDCATGGSTRLFSESSEPELAALIGASSSDVPVKFERPKTPEPFEDVEGRDDNSEFSSEAQASVAELEQEYHGALSRQKPECSTSAEPNYVFVEDGGREKHELETSECQSKENKGGGGTALNVDETRAERSPSSRSDVSSETDQGREYVVNDVGGMMLDHPEFDVAGTSDIIAPPASMADPVTDTLSFPKYLPEDSDYSSMATEEMTSISPVGKRVEEHLDQEQQWMEMQFDDASKIYGFQMEFEREPPSLYPQPLEDIEEEKEELGDKKELEHLKDSLSSTPDYDVLAGRKCFVRTGESDSVSVNSVNSLQEFEKLEKELALDSIRKRTSSTGSQDSGNGKRAATGRQGDASSVGSASSLNEFETLEKECVETEKIENKAKAEEAILSEIEEGHESQISESESCETLSDHGKNESDSEDDYEQRMVEIDEIIKQAQTNVESFERGVPLKEMIEAQGSGEATEETSVVDRTDSIGREEGDADSLEEAQLPDLELDLEAGPVAASQSKVRTDTRKASTDSLDRVVVQKMTVDSSRSSQDSLELKQSPRGPDVMQGSADSLDAAKILLLARGSDVMQTSTDSLEVNIMQGSTDSLEAKYSSSKSDPMQASTDSLETHTQEQSQSTDAMTTSADSIDFQHANNKVMTASADSLEPSESVGSVNNKISTLSSIESGDEDSCKRATDPESYRDSSSGRDGDLSSSGREDHPKPLAHREFYSSNESLEITSSGATNATWQETESGMTASITSAESATLVSSTDTLDADCRGGISPFASPYGSAPSADYESEHQRMYTETYTVTDKEGGTRSYHKYMMYPEEPKVTEISQPCDEADFSHTIKKTVQMPPDVRKVTFTGPEAGSKMREFIGKFEPGEDVEEQEQVDEFGNVHVKKIVRKKIIVSGDTRVTDPDALAELEKVAAQELEGDVDEQVIEATDEFGTVRRIIKRTVAHIPEPETRTSLSETEDDPKVRDSLLLQRLSGSETVLTTSDSSSPDSQQMMKSFPDCSEQGELIEEHEEVDEHGVVHIKRTIHKRVVVPGETVTLSGPGAAEQFEIMAKDRDVKEEVLEETDEHGNVRKYIKRTLVKPEVQTVTFSGPDAEEKMKKFLESQGETVMGDLPTSSSPAPISQLAATSDKPLGVTDTTKMEGAHHKEGEELGGGARPGSDVPSLPHSLSIEEEEVSYDVREHDWRFSKDSTDGADMEPRIYEQQETSGSPVESHQHTTPEGATVHTTQYTTPDGTTVRTTHTRVVSEGVSGDSDAIQQQMQEMMADVMQQQQQEH